ncbi:MAG: hypothetical protein ACJA2S_000345 [Cyclobacteriaceae bacterium]|jgi:hypothetical protein
MYRFLAFIFIFCQGVCAFSASSWDGGASTTSWCDANNWNPNGVPDATDDVTIADGFSVEIPSGCNAVTDKLNLEGNLTIKTGGSLTSDDKVKVGANLPTATLSIEESATFTLTADLEVKGNDTYAVGNGPTLSNSGTINTDSDIKIGRNSGQGILNNYATGIITLTGSDEVMHVDGTICNFGLLKAIGTDSELQLHGAVLKGGGTMWADSFKIGDHDKGATGEGTSIGPQSFFDSSGSCSSTNSTPPEFGGLSFDDLLGGDWEDCENDDFCITSPGMTFSCGESAASVLPVKLLSFYGASNKGQVELSWSTATEINNDHFEIESSIDGIAFTIIGEVKGNGDSNEVLAYSFMDENPPGFENYYRLKQVDYDGQFEYFNTIMVLNTRSSAIKVYPNPTSANRTLIVQVNNSLEPELVSVELTDISGRILEKKLGYDNFFVFSTAHLIKGTYLIRVSINSIKSISKVLVD